MKRPTGVTVLGWLAIVFGALGLVVAVTAVFGALALMALGAGAVGAGGVAGGAALAGSAVLLVVLAIWTALLCAVEITFGVGALQLKPWAWTLGMIWTWVSIASNIVTLVANRGSGLVSTILGVLVAIAILYYLYTDEVRAAFGKTSQTPPSFMVPVFAQIDKMLNSSKSAAPAPAPASPTPAPPAASAPPAPPAPPAPAQSDYTAPPAPPAPPA